MYVFRLWEESAGLCENSIGTSGERENSTQKDTDKDMNKQEEATPLTSEPPCGL